jgi:curli biogenesis system outer membrane secretion channel CsgG
MQLTRKLSRFIFSCVILCLTFSVQASIKYVTVDTNGTGASEQAAINDALVNAISEVNGVEVAAKIHLQTSEKSDQNSIETNESFQQAINKESKGLIKEYTVLNRQESDLSNGLWSAKVRVTIAKFVASKQVNRLRIAILPFKPNESIPQWKKPAEFQNKITQDLVSYMTQTRKFAILDRENVDIQQKELSMLRNGQAPVEELAKLGQRLSTDYIIVGSIDDIHYLKNEKQLKVSGKTITTVKQGARVSFRVIDVATGQVKFSDSLDKILHTSRSGVSVSVVSKKAATDVGNTILNAIYPIRVEAVQDTKVYLGQGGTTLRQGDEYTLVMLGNVLKDSYTGESLGREEKQIGTVRITVVQAKQSQGKITQSHIDVARLFKPGDFIIRPKHQSQTKQISFVQQKKAAKKSVDELEESLSSDW